MGDRVVVPLDGSSLSERAIDPAVEVAERTGAQIELVQWRPGGYSKPHSQRYLDEVALGLPVGVDAVTTVAVANAEAVPDEIAALAAEPGTLICLSSHGRGGLGRALLGSTAEGYLRVAPAPVLMVGPSLGPKHRIGSGRIVACLDGSADAERIVPFSAEWAATLHLELWLVHVTTDANVETAYLAHLARLYAPASNWDELHGNDPARAIVDFADRWDVGLLAMTTHGRTGWSRFAIGSVAMGVLRHAPCPVLVAGPAVVPGSSDPTHGRTMVTDFGTSVPTAGVAVGSR